MMKRFGKIKAIQKYIMVLSAVFLLTASVGADYSVSRYTIDSGGGVSIGGSYIVRGTIGQPDAAYSAGGNYELLGGFWSGELLCIVDFYQYAVFAEYWLESGSGLIADLYEDAYDKIDYFDLSTLADEWLCSCPYGWPLR